MTIKRTLSDVTRGADITKPELSVQYILAATLGVVVLIFAWRMGGMIFAKGDSLIQGRLTGVPVTDYKAALGIV